MKKFTYSALLLAGAMFLGLDASAQVVDGKYTEYDSDLLIPINIDYVTLKTGGTTMGYYAKPDPAYHPNYNATATTPWALTADFVWDWTVPTKPASSTIAPVKPAATPANYVQFTYDKLGNYTVNVAEKASAAFGGCADATPTVMKVTVINPPSAAITGAHAGADWNETTADHEYYRCGDLLGGENVTVTITETGVSAALASYAYSVKKVVENIDASGIAIGGPLSSTLFSDYKTPAGSKYKTNTADGGTEVKSTGDLTVLNSLRTKYTYTLQKASDLDAVIPQGIVSAISHKSDFVSSGDANGATAANDKINTYGFTGTVTVIYIVNPAPVTGPIYHIANTFAY